MYPYIDILTNQEFWKTLLKMLYIDIQTENST